MAILSYEILLLRLVVLLRWLAAVWVILFESSLSAIGKADGVSGLSLKPSAFLKNDGILGIA
jgi:hypothetical protein